jgi:hypothetical protein
MAKKPRTPSPPRKVQAPKVRQKDARSRTVTLPSTNVLAGVGLVAVTGLAIALIVVLAGRGGGSSADVDPQDVTKVAAAMRAAGCTFRSTPAEASNQHMSDPDQKVAYKTFPPSSGVHNPGTAIWGNYRLQADPRQLVHNLEHGGVIIWYGPNISARDRGELDAFYDDDPDGIVITPLEDSYPRVTYPKHEPLGSKIALTAWTTKAGQTDTGTVYIATCPRFDAAAFAAYRDAFRGKGPERAPISSLAPGGH